MEFKPRDFKGFNITPEILAIINDADQVEEICKMLDVNIDTARIKSLVRKEVQYVILKTHANIAHYLCEYIFYTARDLVHVDDMKKYCTGLCAINEFAQFLEETDERTDF